MSKFYVIPRRNPDDPGGEPTAAMISEGVPIRRFSDGDACRQARYRAGYDPATGDNCYYIPIAECHACAQCKETEMSLHA